MTKKVIIHLGYHKTGTSSIQQWLKNHEEVLAPHLKTYNLVDGGTNALKFATIKLARTSGCNAELLQETQRISKEIRESDQPVTCITDESILGMPLGFRTASYTETEVYPAACRIIEILSRQFSEFDTTFVVVEREKKAWFSSLHNQMVKQDCFEGDLEAYYQTFHPSVDWSALRYELEYGIGERARLVALQFEQEFASGSVAKMGFFRLLDIPESLMAQCDPSIPRINVSVPLKKKAPQQPPRPAQVLGGSNSMMRGGWVNLLRTEYRAVVQAENLSIGACTSAMALYRLLALEKRQPGIPLIWEYGVNEYNHMMAGQSLDSLLYHVEWMLQLAIRENSPFLPVLMRNRVQAEMAEPDAYISAITALFESYGVPPLDCNRLIHVLSRGDVDLLHWYGDPAHYSIRTEFPQRLAETVALSLEGARIPQAPAERAERFGASQLKLFYPEKRSDRFDNSLVQCAFSQFRNAPQVRVGTAHPLAAIIVTSGSGPNIRISDNEGGVIGYFSTQVAHGPDIPEQQLRQLILAPGDKGLQIPGGVLHIATDTTSEHLQVQNMFVQQPPPETVHPNGLVALLCEQSL